MHVPAETGTGSESREPRDQVGLPFLHEFRRMPDGSLPGWLRPFQGEHRWQVSLAVAVALAAQLALPHQLVLGPRWLLPTLEAALIIPLVIGNPVRLTRETRALRTLSLSLIVLIGLANGFSIGLLVHELLHGTAAGGKALLASAVAIWITNVIVFGLAYWELDRGGPVARSQGRLRRPDFLFPQMQAPELAGPEWRPVFMDYLYVAFTNSTAFSPTDTMPLVPWAKMLMLVQSAVSLVAIGLVVARAVNILS